MNILTDILSLIRRGVYAEKAGVNDVLVLGVNEEPEMTGVASPIPYKSVKLIKVKDFKIAASNCENKNSPTVPASGTGQVYQKTDVDATTQACTVLFRSLKSMSSNLTFATSADDNYVEITTEGEPNLASNVGTGAPIWKDKLGETLRFRSLVEGSGITIGQSSNEITITNNGPSSLTTTGTSGASTLIGGVLNIPNYATGGGGEVNTASNVGPGTGVFKQKTVADLEFKTFTSLGGTVTITQTATTIDLAAAGGGGGADFLVNGDSGSPQTVVNGDTLIIEGGDGIETVGTGGPKVVVNMEHYYTAYVCKLSQTGTNNPTESIVYNDTGLTLTWSRVGVGQFRAVWSTPQDGTKVTVNPMCTFKNTPNLINVTAFSNASFTLSTWNLSGTSVEVDDTLLNSPVEIRIYP
tara:strand:- start:8503 stop:9732 length:1230 start_codon:yes stop_codon:yes gene_type:complete